MTDYQEYIPATPIEKPIVIDPIYNKHYICIDEQNRIIDGFSDAFREPTETDICINEQGSYQFRLFPGGEENPSLYNPDGIPLYQWVDGQVLLRTPEEIQEDKAAQEPILPQTPIDQRIAAVEDAITALAFGGAV